MEDKKKIQYEYLSINVKSKLEPMVMDTYENFGWEIITSSALTDKEDYYINNTGTNGEKLVNIKFKRDRKINNKEKLNVLQNKKKGYENGIDDFITKPIDYEELVLKIDAILRRYHILNTKELKIGKTILNTDNYTVQRENEVINFTKKEFELLYKLLSFPDKIFTKMQLLEEIWGYDSESLEDTIKIHISKIRKKLENVTEFEIVTAKGLGYKAVIKEDEVGK